MYRILLAEDEKMIRNGLRHLINQVIGGFEVVWEAENGRRALEIMQIEKPDLLVTDIRMPGIDGLELIRRIRHLLMDMPVIVVSGFDDFEYAKKAMKFGVRHYMLKPVEPAEMAEALSEIREELSEEPSRASYKGESRLIKQIKEIVDDELSNTITLQLIGDMVHLHPNYVSHIFKKETGQTLIDYVMKKYVYKIVLEKSSHSRVESSACIRHITVIFQDSVILIHLSGILHRFQRDPRAMSPC